MRLILNHQKFISRTIVKQEAKHSYIKNAVTLWGNEAEQSQSYLALSTM